MIFVLHLLMYIATFDPLDGSSNINSNITVRLFMDYIMRPDLTISVKLCKRDTASWTLYYGADENGMVKCIN